MAREHLGLFDTPPDRRQVRLGLVIVGLLLAACLLIQPLRDVPVGAMNAYVPMFDAVMCVGDLITATLLFAQASVFRSRALTMLASGYIYTALMLIPHAVTFPGAFSPNGYAAEVISPWLSILRRNMFPLAVLLYVAIRRAEAAKAADAERPSPRIATGVVSAVVLAAAATLLASTGLTWLPPFFAQGSGLFQVNAMGYEAVEFAFFLVAAVVLFRARA